MALRLGPIEVHWYGLMYLAGFLVAWWLGARRAERQGWQREEMADLIFYAALGVIIGGRLGYVFFYKPAEFLANPLMLFAIQQGGMSFHGGLLGVLTAGWLYARKTGRSFFAVTDFVAPLVPPGLFAGRLGNFVNGELWGAPSTLPWAMVFPHAGPEPRHPSQLYEAALEGVVLFALLWWFTRRPRPLMAVSGLFLLGYGVGRFAVEFVRQPDAHLGYLAFGWLTTGHLLTAPMIVAGALLMVLAYRRAAAASPDATTDAAPARTRARTRPRRRGGRG